MLSCLIIGECMVEFLLLDVNILNKCFVGDIFNIVVYLKCNLFDCVVIYVIVVGVDVLSQ